MNFPHVKIICFYCLCFSLSPFETARIRLISASSARAVAVASVDEGSLVESSSISGNKQSQGGLVSALKEIVAAEGLEGLFKGLPSMLLKGLPYTIVQLSVFEFLTSAIYSSISDLGIFLCCIQAFKKL